MLISWQPPEGVAPTDVQSYHVYVDADFKTSVKATERTKALLENVDSSRVRELEAKGFCLATQLITTGESGNGLQLMLNASFLQTHRIVVRTVTNRGQSKDAECTILVGKGE